jgi:hypothetical protein
MTGDELFEPLIITIIIPHDSKYSIITMIVVGG